MRIVWSLPVRGAAAATTRGDLVRHRALVAALRAQGHEVVVVPADDASTARAGITAYRRVVRRLFPGAVALSMREAGRLAHGVAHGRRVAAVARREDADAIVETQVHFAGSGAVAARLTGLPLLLDDGSPAMEERLLGSPLPGLARQVLRYQARAARAVAVSSASLRDALIREGIPAGKLYVVPNGVDLAWYGAATREDGRRSLGLAPHAVAAVFVGSFQPWHGLDLLVEALRRLESSPLHLVLVGDGPGRNPLLERFDEEGLSGRVTAPGTLRGPDLAQVLAAADIGVLPGSNDYGQPMKLLDYAAAHLPIVAPDLAPVREVVEAGRTAVLFPAGDAGGLVRALSRLAADDSLRRRMGREARKRVADPAAWVRRARALPRLLGRREEAGPARAFADAPSLGEEG